MNKQRCRIAVISDVHYASAPPGLTCRKGHWGAVLLRRTVRRLNRYVKPDVTVILGDLLDDEHAADAEALLTTLKGILDQLASPWLAIPGNHDPSAMFYDLIDPPDHLDVNGVRLVAFDDPPAPGHNAERNAAGFARMAELAADHDGPRVALQHVPVGVPCTQTPYGYTNCDEVLAAMRDHGYTLALSGHAHAGAPLTRQDGLATMTVPALCEAPYHFALVTVAGDDIHAEPLAHQLPEKLALNDYHSHTQFAYCAQDVSTDRSPALAALMGVNQLAFTEHSGQLYFQRRAYWNAVFGERGIEETQGRAERMADYWRVALPCRDESVRVGLEVDADFHGNPVVEPADRQRADLVLGAVHWLRELQKPEPDMAVAADEFLAVVEGLCRAGVDILAHPYRVFRRSDRPVPEHTCPAVVKLLKKHGVAAEINFHANEPSPSFFKLCLDAGVPLSFGGDAHELDEIGEFHPQLAMLKQIGFDGELGDILIPPRR